MVAERRTARQNGPVKDSDLAKRLAPDVEPAWAEAFLWSLHVRGIQGRRVVEALTKVNDEVALMRLSAEDIFGSPDSYAASLPPPEEPSGPWGMFRLTVPPIVGFAGLGLVGLAVPPLRHGTLVTIPLGWVISVVAFVVAGFVLAVRRDVILALAQRRADVAIGVGVAMCLAVFLPAVVVSNSLGAVAPWIPLACGVVLVGLASYLYVRQARAAVPLEPPPEWVGQAPTLTRPGRGWAVVYPVGAVLLAAYLWLFR